MSFTDVALGDVVSIDRVAVHPAMIMPGTPYVGLENIERGGRLVGVADTQAGQLASAKFQFSDEHVLFGKLRPNLAKVARPDFKGICSTDILPIRPHASLDRRYLAHWLLAPRTVARATSRATGVNLPRLSPTELLRFPIPLPAIQEQRRIADILDRADALRAKRRQTQALLDDLTRSLFIQTFGDFRSSSFTTRLGYVVRPATGGTPSRGEPRNFGGTTPWVKTAEVTGGTVTSTEEAITERGLASARLRVFPVDSILIALYGQGRTRGQCAVLGIPAATNQACAVLVPGDYDSAFLFVQLRLAYERLRAMARGGNQANLNLELVGSLPVIMPPRAAQHAFSERSSAIVALHSKSAGQLGCADTLFAALQQGAFAGAL